MGNPQGNGIGAFLLLDQDLQVSQGTCSSVAVHAYASRLPAAAQMHREAFNLRVHLHCMTMLHKGGF